MASTSLSRTPASAGNTQTFTWSGWVKRSSFGSSTIFGCGPGTSDRSYIVFSNDNIGFYIGTSGPTYRGVITSAVFRDVSAWYHIVVAVDTTQATDTNRAKIYVNGQLQSVGSYAGGYNTLNQNSNINTTIEHAIGEQVHTSSNYFDGEMAHIHFIDGTAYDASDFGQTDSTTGIWKPITVPSVTYGTNGFFLKFANSGSMGTDSSGNGNNFTVSGNLTQTQDTPSNVFATLNPIRAAGDTRTFANGNTKVTAKTTDGLFHCSYSTLGVTQGKWYAEFKLAVGGYPINSAIISGGSVEVSQDDANNNGNAVGQTSYNGVGSFVVDNVSASGKTTYTSGDIIGVAMNVDDGELTFYKNGTIVDTTQNLTTTAGNGICYFIAITRYIDTQASWEANFGNGYFGTTAVSSANSDDAGYGLFEYAPPTGYYALCTKNINTYG